MLVIHSQTRKISYRSQNIEKEDVEKIYLIIGGFYDSDNYCLNNPGWITVSLRRTVIILLLALVSIMTAICPITSR